MANVFPERLVFLSPVELSAPLSRALPEASRSAG